MWGNFLRFVGPDGITVDELTARPGVETWALPGMMRWGYVAVEGGTGAWRGKQPPRDATVHLRSSGRRAAAIWSGLSEPLQRRWRKRFGSEQIDALRDALARLAGHAERELPHYLIDGRYEMRVELPRAGDTDGGRTAQRAAAAELDLVALLCQTLLLYAADYDARASRGIALGANALRVMSADPVRLRDLAPRVGLARETTDVIVGRMAKWGLATIDGERTASRGKVARLTDAGLRARARVPADGGGGRVRVERALWRARARAPAHGADRRRRGIGGRSIAVVGRARALSGRMASVGRGPRVPDLIIRSSPTAAAIQTAAERSDHSRARRTRAYAIGTSASKVSSAQRSSGLRKLCVTARCTSVLT